MTGITTSAVIASKTQTYDLDISPAPCKQALLELASQTKHEILFEKNAEPQESCPSLKNTMSLEEALTLTLAPLDLAFSISDGQIRIHTAKKKEAVLPKITVLGYLRGTSNAQIVYEDDSLERFPLASLPLSVQSIKEEQISNVQARTMDDAISYIASIEFFDSVGGLTPSFYSRGITTPFSVNGKFYSRTLLPFDPAVLERIDLVQGPTANYMFPGGLLNFVTKKPHEKQELKYRVSGGSYDFYRGEVDINFAEEEHKTQTRLVAVAENSKGIKDFTAREQYTFSPSFNYAFDNGAQFHLWGMHQEIREFPNNLTYHESLLGERLPREQQNAFPWSWSKRIDSFLAVTLSDITWEDWTISTGANWNRFRLDFANTLFGPGPEEFRPDDDPENPPTLFLYNEGSHVSTYGFDVSLERPVSLFGLDGILRTGVEHQRYDILTRTHFILGVYNFFPTIDIYQPDYSIPEPDKPITWGYDTQPTDFYGFFVTQSYDITDYLTMYLDLRYEDMQFEDIRVNELFDLRIVTTARYQELTPQIGFNIDLSDTLTAHLSYNESFSYQFAFDIDKLLSTGAQEFSDPLLNKQYEIALKKKWLDKNLLSSLTLYRITSSNILFSNFNLQGFYKSIAPNRIYEGAILNTTGSITPDIEIIANISYNDNNVTVASGLDLNGVGIPSDDTTKRGRVTAKHVGNLFLHYDANSGQYKKINFGLGIKYVGERYGDDLNTFVLPSYTTYDTFLEYEFNDTLSVELSVRNVFDKYYYKSSLGSLTTIEEGEPRTFTLTLKSSFDF